MVSILDRVLAVSGPSHQVFLFLKLFNLDTYMSLFSKIQQDIDIYLDPSLEETAGPERVKTIKINNYN